MAEATKATDTNETKEAAESPHLPGALLDQYSNRLTQATQSNDALLIALEALAHEIGFVTVFKEGQGQQQPWIVTGADKLLVLNFIHPTCPAINCGLRCLILSPDRILVYAFVENTYINNLSLSVGNFFRQTGDIVYPNLVELRRVARNELLLKILAEAQHRGDVPQSFGITKVLFSPDIIEEIFLYLDLRDIYSCTLVNQSVNAALDNMSFWRKLYLQRFHGETSNASSTNWKSVFKDKVVEAAAIRRRVNTCIIRHSPPVLWPPRISWL